MTEFSRSIESRDCVGRYVGFLNNTWKKVEPGRASLQRNLNTLYYLYRKDVKSRILIPPEPDYIDDERDKLRPMFIKFSIHRI